MKRIESFCLGLCLSLLVFIPSVHAGLSYEGSSTISEVMLPEVAKAMLEKKGLAFDSIGKEGSGKGFKTVMTGAVDIGGMSRPLTTDEKMQHPYYMVIAFDAIAVFVNSRNPVQSLSSSQIRDVFSGTVTNWKEVGGPDLLIEVVTEIKTAGRATLMEFQEMALEGRAFGPGKEIDKPLDCVRHVEDHPNAVTFATISFGNPGVKAIAIDGIEPSATSLKSAAYPFSRPLMVVMRYPPKGDVKTFMDFILSEEGQSIVGKFFVPIR